MYNTRKEAIMFGMSDEQRSDLQITNNDAVEYSLNILESDVGRDLDLG